MACIQALWTMGRLFLALLVAPAHAKCQFADVAGARMPRDATHASARRRADDSGTYVHRPTPKPTPEPGEEELEA